METCSLLFIFLFRRIVPKAVQPIMHRCKHRLKYNLSHINKQQLHIQAQILVPRRSCRGLPLNYLKWQFSI